SPRDRAPLRALPSTSPRDAQPPEEAAAMTTAQATPATARATAADGSMRATIFHGPGNVTVESRPRPVPGPGEVRLRVGGASLCASDVRVYRGEKHASPGVIPGHEVAGVVDAVGSGVTGIAEG